MALRVGYLAIGICAADALLLILIKGKGPAPQVNVLAGRLVLAGALLSAAVVVPLFVYRHRARRRGERATTAGSPVNATARFISPETTVAGVLALGVLLVLSAVPTYLLAEAAKPPTQHSPLYAYFDRRWLVALFLLGSLGPLVVLPILARAASAARTSSMSEPSPVAGISDAVEPMSSPPVRGPRARWTRSTWAKLALGAALGWYFFGPPWGIVYNQQPIDAHEIFQLGALQAWAAGATPYIGAAGSQYGPGSQLVAWLYMLHLGSFSIVGFRESFALFQWSAATVLLGAIFVRLRLRLAIATALLALLLFPSFDELAFGNLGRLTPHHVFGGFFGWFNLWRFTGVAVLLLFFPKVASAPRHRLLRGLALGIFWGLTCYLAQEDLAAGILGVGVLALLLVVSRTARGVDVAWSLGAIGLGAVIAWLPVLGFYAAHGDLHQFISNYFLVPGAVTKGYSDTPFAEGPLSDWGPLFYVLPVLLPAVGLLSIVELRPLRIATRWPAPRVLLVTAVVISTVTYSGALLRSDASHLINAILVLPLLIVLTVAYLPRLLGWRPRISLAVIGLLSIVIAALALPLRSFSDAPRRLWSPIAARYSLLTRTAPPAVSPTTAGTRIGRGLADARVCCTTSIQLRSVPMPQLVSFLNQLHDVVGPRRAYVTSDLLDATGLLYFGAHLNPAMMYVEPGTMLVDQHVTRRYMAYFAAHVRGVGALVTLGAVTKELTYFESAFPRFRDIHLTAGNQDVHVLLAR